MSFWNRRERCANFTMFGAGSSAIVCPRVGPIMTTRCASSGVGIGAGGDLGAGMRM
jgi:hypothetical protein